MTVVRTLNARLHRYSRLIRERLEVTANGDLDHRDISYIHDIFVMRFALLSDLLAGSTLDTNKVLEHWERTTLGLKTLNVELYSSDWKTCREIVTSVGFRNVFPDPDACAAYFKGMSQGRIHYKWIMNSVIELIGGCADWFFKINQWVVFDSKANLTSLDLTTECCTEYLQFERDLQASKFEWHHLPVVQRCAKDMFGDFIITNYPFRPKHGNGATAELSRRDSDAWHKNRHFAVDGEIINYLRYRVPESDWHDWFYVPYRGLDRTSQLVCVPKSMTKNRTISKEPTTLQYLQQDVFAAMDDYFKSHLSAHIDLHDQERSRVLALKGSADGSYATIDLSSASDSVTVRHVDLIFDGLPIQYPLFATRSHWTKVQDKSGSISDLVELEKFAPMGSSVCFPLECSIFAILCEAAIRLSTGHTSRKFDYVVYGDDIVIKSEYASELVLLLDEFGFVVNSDKSFVDDDSQCPNHFREACGIEAFNGDDITPLRLSRRLVSVSENDSDRQAGLGVGIIDLLNRTFLFGYRDLHRWINDLLIERHWYRRLLRVSRSDYYDFVKDISENRTPWLDVASPYVITEDRCDTQWCAFKRRSILASPTHRLAAFCLVAKPRQPKMHHDSNDYFTWCVSRSDKTDVLDFEIDAQGIVTIRSQDLKWVRTWVPLPFGAPHYLRQRPAHVGRSV